MNAAELELKDIDESVKPFWAALKRTWFMFCMKTSIHGLKFTNETSNNRFIRYVWWSITICCFICSISMVIEFYSSYRSNPTRMNLGNDHAPVTSLNFPAITICPEKLFNMEQSERYISKLKLPPFIKARNIVDKLNMIAGFIDNEDEQYNDRDIDLMEQVLRLNNISVDQFLYNLKWDCGDMLFRCRYRYQILPCSDLFQVARSFLGYCCAFNLNQTGLKYTSLNANAGLRGGLSVVLHSNDSSSQGYYDISLGFRIIIDENAIFPNAQSIMKYASYNEEVFAAIRPVEIYCSEAVKTLQIEERQCVFPNEIILNHFSLYSGSHCELDCLILNVFRYCGCIPYYIIHNEIKYRTCSFKDLPCLFNNNADITGRNRNAELSCPSDCEIMNYAVQVTNTELQIDIPTADPFYNDLKRNYTIVHFFMNSQLYRRVRRDLLSSTIMLASNLGSAFSLFVGMSMVSLVEIIYYFTVVMHKNYIQEIKAREKLLFQRKTQE